MEPQRYTKGTKKRRKDENYKSQITNYKPFFGNGIQIIPMG
jgi:hypothetical protein